MLDVQDTIVGVASASGGGVRGVIRLSGPRVLQCLDACFLPAAARTVSPLGLRRPHVLHGMLELQPRLGRLPGDLYVWPTERSYTRQPAAEFHTIGSPPLLEASVRTFVQNGARLAAPGEFTMRAFLAGRIDLTQAEAVLGVIDAHDERELDIALTQLAGGLATPMHEIRNRLLDLLAHVEAGLDFVEEDIEFITAETLQNEIREATTQIAELNAQISQREQSTTLPQVVLWGPPNTGKSSLFNALAGDAAAIVSNVPGTTRDYLTCELSAAGHPFLLVDTAGYDPQALDPIETQAQSLTKRQHGGADLVLVCRDATATDVSHPSDLQPNHLLIWTKCDQIKAQEARPGIRTSSVSGAGLSELLQLIGAWCAEQRPAALAAVPATVTRCRVALTATEKALASAAELTNSGGDESLIAADVRTALDQLGQIVGVIYTEDLLDRIFSRFCIGK